MTTISFYNYDSNLIKVSYVGGGEDGIDRYYKKSDVSFIDNGPSFIKIKTSTETTDIKYSQVSTTNPSYHTTTAQLIAVLETWVTEQIDNISSVDLYYRKRSIEAVTLFDSVFKASIETNSYYTILKTDATITHVPNEECVDITVPTTSNSRAVFQSRPYMYFTSATTTILTFSAILRTTLSVSNNTVRIGLFDSASDKAVTGDTGGSGCFFILDANGTISVVTRAFPAGTQVDTAVPQTSWNIDRMDGFGISKMNLNVTRINTYVIELSAEGSGSIRFGIVSNSRIYYVHTINSTNLNTLVPIKSCCIPFRAESVNTNVSGSTSTTYLYSVNVSLEGEKASNFYTGRKKYFSVDTDDVKVNAGSVPLVSIGIAPGARCRNRVILDNISLSTITNAHARLRLVINGTLGGTTTWVNGTDSALQTSKTNTSITGGTTIYTKKIFPNSGQIPEFIQFNLAQVIFGSLDGSTGDYISIVIDNLGSNVTTSTSANFTEYY